MRRGAMEGRHRMTAVQPEEIGPGPGTVLPGVRGASWRRKFCANCGHEMATAPRPTAGPPPRLDLEMVG